MAVPRRTEYQNTTVRLPRKVYERARTAVDRSPVASSFNDFVVQAIEQKLDQLGEAEIDAAFAHMAEDADYQRASVAMARSFANSDWEAFQATDADREHHHTKARTAKTRSR